MQGFLIMERGLILVDVSKAMNGSPNGLVILLTPQPLVLGALLV